jgi:predicted regulator of Ras-like GTPase activity (Roadblock/LC7/MglB family)
MRYGSLNQLIITGEDGRQILFVQLKQGVLAALTDKNVNLGLLRIALHDLLRKAQG